MLNQMLLLTVFVIDTFRMRNPWFYDLKPRLSDRNLMGFIKHFHLCINIQKWKCRFSININQYYCPFCGALFSLFFRNYYLLRTVGCLSSIPALGTATLRNVRHATVDEHR